MKAKTNAGEVKLTSDMVRRGMVFCAVTGARVTYVSDVNGAFAREWADGYYVALLGCDPRIAAREDCERYGIAPGVDAGAHGFARLRDGGAVDLRREMPGGWAIQNADGTFNVGRQGWRLPDGAKFIGLAAPLACPEDIERLCCGARLAAYEDHLPAESRCTLAIGDHAEHEDLATGVRWPARETITLHDGKGSTVQARWVDAAEVNAVPAWSSAGTRQCTSAMLAFRPPQPVAVHRVVPRPPALADAGPSDIVVPQRPTTERMSGPWSAGFRFIEDDVHVVNSAEDVDRLLGKGSEFGGKVKAAIRATEAARTSPITVCHVEARKVWEPGKASGMCPHCMAGHIKAQSSARMGDYHVCIGGCGRSFGGRSPSSDPHLNGKGEACDGVRPERGPCPRCGRSRAPATAAACVSCGCRGACPSKARGEVDPDATPCGSCGCRWCGPMTPEAERRRRDTPLVALVNAVPEGLDATGWRAAVLAVREEYLDGDAWTMRAVIEHTATCLRGQGEPVSETTRRAIAAYRRAIEPHKAPPRQPLTWKRRGPALPVDDGRDDA